MVPVPSSLYWEIMNYYLERTVEVKIFNVSLRQARNIVYSFTEQYLKKKWGHTPLDTPTPWQC